MEEGGLGCKALLAMYEALLAKWLWSGKGSFVGETRSRELWGRKQMGEA